VSQCSSETKALRDRIEAAREKLASVTLPQDIMERITGLCVKIGTDGMRGELTMLRAARALAALEDCDVVTTRHLRSIAPSALRHRLRRNPLDESGSSARIARTMEDVFCAC
jgi:magnesium chelatase subunit I